MKKNAFSPLGWGTAAAESRRLTDAAYRAERHRRAPFERIARLIISHRMATGLTQKALAAQVGTSESAISRLERGDHSPSVDTLLRLADVFGKELIVDFVAAPDEAPVQTVSA